MTEFSFLGGISESINATSVIPFESVILWNDQQNASSTCTSLNIKYYNSV